MAIDIRRGPAGEGSLLMGFIGLGTDNTSATNIFSYVNTLSAAVHSEDPDYVDVIDTKLTENNPGHTIYNVGKVHYTDWTTDSGVTTFSSASEVADYINNTAVNAIALIQERSSLPEYIPEVLNVGIGVTFTHKVLGTQAVSYFWNEGTFPPDVTVSRYDRRVVTGFVTFAGTFDMEFEMRNQVGITSSYLQVVVS